LIETVNKFDEAFSNAVISTKIVKRLSASQTKFMI
jgi:hypothetical protein